MFTVVVSSTIEDLKAERLFLKRLLEASAPVPLKALLSEASDFPVSPSLLAEDPYDVALANLRRSDFAIQLIGARYGAPTIGTPDPTSVSITHQEYRLAYDRRIPLYSLVRADVWETWWTSGGAHEAAIAAGIDQGVFDLLAETQANPRRKWIFPWRDADDLETIVRSSFFHHDESAFQADVTTPDGETFDPGARFEKIWAIRNAGFLHTGEAGLCAASRPDFGCAPTRTRSRSQRRRQERSPGRASGFTAPAYPRTARSEWKMFDADGRACFPWMKGLWCEITVVNFKD